MDFLNSIQNVLVGIAAAATSLVGITTNAPSANDKTVPASQPTQVIQENMITRSGEISYAGQSVKYIINIPKNGGQISGSLSGICQGNITGTYNGVEGGNVNGSANPSCGVAFLRKSFNITYSGVLFLKQGRANLNWEGDIPSSPGKGTYTFNFEPEK